jgi:hypothetical protein
LRSSSTGPWATSVCGLKVLKLLVHAAFSVCVLKLLKLLVYAALRTISDEHLAVLFHRSYSGSIQALFRLYSGSIKGSIKGSIQALVRLY